MMQQAPARRGAARPSKGFLVGVGCLGVATVVGFAVLFKMASDIRRVVRPRQGAPSAGRCVAVNDEALAAVAKGLASSGLSLRNGWAVRSRDHKAATYLSAELVSDTSAWDGRIETWAWAAEQPGAGQVFAISPMAVALSDWPDGSLSTFKLGNLDDGAEASRTCVRNHRPRRQPRARDLSVPGPATLGP